jgi:hypothetical protein
MSESDMASLRGAKIVSEMLETSPELFEEWEDWSVEIVDELGTVIQRLTLPYSSETPTSGSDEGSQQGGQRRGHRHTYRPPPRMRVGARGKGAKRLSGSSLPLQR